MTICHATKPGLNLTDLKVSLVSLLCAMRYGQILSKTGTGSVNEKKIKNSFDFLRGEEKTRVSIFGLGFLRKFVRVRSRLRPGLKFIP